MSDLLDQVGEHWNTVFIIVLIGALLFSSSEPDSTLYIVGLILLIPSAILLLLEAGE